MSAIYSGLLAILDPSVLVFVAIGVLVCQVIAIIPGLGGPFVIAMLLPFIYGMDPLAAIAMLVGAGAVSATGNSVTTILLGVPGSGAGLATLFDGYPMAKKGEGGRALAAAMVACMFGGIIGAVALAGLLPLVRPIIMIIGPAEYFVVVLGALILMAKITQGDTIKALIALSAGFAISMVGQDPVRGSLRYTFGQLYLWEGLPLVPIIIGLFAIAEMVQLTERGLPIAGVRNATITWDQIKQGGRDCLTYWRSLVESSIIGVLIGVVPGIGGGTPALLAYGKAANRAERRKTSPAFGEGAVEGVIVADAPTNSNDGGALVSTLALGIPGSTSMALLLVGMISLGVQPGLNMLNENAHITWMIIFSLVIANIMATMLVLSAAKYLAKVTLLPPAFVIAPVYIICFFGAFMARGVIHDVALAIIFGIIGYGMKRYGYSRIVLTVSLVLGPLLERNFHLLRGLYGMGFLQRPATIVLITLFTATIVVIPLIRRVRSSRSSTTVQRGTR